MAATGMAKGGKVPVAVITAQRRNNDPVCEALLSQLVASQLFAGLIDNAAERVFDVIERLTRKLFTVNAGIQRLQAVGRG